MDEKDTEYTDLEFLDELMGNRELIHQLRGVVPNVDTNKAKKKLFSRIIDIEIRNPSE